MEQKQPDGAAIPHLCALAREARDSETPPERLSELSEYAELRPLVAANPAVPEELLDKMSRDTDPQVRRAVAGNPNGSLECLLRLAREFPEAFFHNPLCLLLELSQPEWRAQVEHITWLALLKSEEMPLEWLRWLEQKQWSVSRGRREAGDIYEVWVAAKLHVTQPEPHANGEHIGRELVRGIATVATHERTPQPLLLELASIVCQYRDIAEIGSGVCEQIRRDVAQNRAAPEAILRLLATDADTIVRHRVGKNQSTPPDLLAQLAADPSAYVRSGVASNQLAPLEILEGLAADTTYEEKYEQARQRISPRASLHDVSRMQAQEALNNLRLVKGSLARNEATPAHILLELAAHPEVEIRERVASNPAAPPAVLLHLADDVERVIESLVDHPRLPVEILTRLATHPLGRIRCGVAHHPHTPPALLGKLAGDEHLRVREAVAQNPATPPDALAHLADSSTHTILLALANNPHLPGALFEHLLRLGEENTNLLPSLMSHPAISLEQLQLLAQHRELTVRQAAQRRLERLSELGERGLLRYPYLPYLTPCFEDNLMQAQPLSIPLYEIHAQALELRRFYAGGSEASWLLNFLRHFHLPAALRQEIFELLLPSWSKQWQKHTEESNAWLAMLAEYHLTPAWQSVFAASPLWKERYAMAVRPEVETAILAQLAHDGNRYVRAAARWYLQERQAAA